MFPLSCACVRVHTSRETSAYKRTWSAHKCSFQKCVLHIYFIYVVPNTDESWKSVAQKKFYVRTNFEKLEGTLEMSRFSYGDAIQICDYNITNKIK